MLDELLKRFSSVVVLVVVMGSLVDLFQFAWICKRTIRKLKRVVYNKIRREVLEDFKQTRK